MNKAFFGLHTLSKIATRSRKRVGRGYGSGKGGHTSGRGQKGQKSRRTIPWSFEGGAIPLSRRLPFLRGKGRLNVLKTKSEVVNLGQLETLANGTEVTIDLLVKQGWVSSEKAKNSGVKVLGRGKLTKKLSIVGLKISEPARQKVEKAGGKIQIKEEGKGKKEEGVQPSQANNKSITKEVTVIATKATVKKNRAKTKNTVKKSPKKISK